MLFFHVFLLGRKPFKALPLLNFEYKYAENATQKCVPKPTDDGWMTYAKNADQQG